MTAGADRHLERQVAILSRVGLEDVVRGLDGEPGFPELDGPTEARAIHATCGGLRVTSVYVPNGRSPDDPHYSYKHQGMRIDLVLAADPVADRVRAAWIDRVARKGSGPSDHAPVMVDLDTAPDGDIGPVIPPPSNPRR